MSATPFEDGDLSDDWIDRGTERPPTLKFSTQSSLSGSVNILSDATQKWTNLNQIVGKDLLTKQTKPLVSLFEPLAAEAADSAACDPSTLHDGLSVVEEEASETNDGHLEINTRDYENAWDDMIDENRRRHAANTLETKGDTGGDTIRPHSSRSSDGLIPNFSFPRSGSAEHMTQTSAEERPVKTAATPSRSVSDTAEPTAAGTDTHYATRATSEGGTISTPKRNTHKSTNSSISPTKSPLKLFHPEQDTFTRDHTARMIGILSGTSADTETRPEEATVPTGTQKSQLSAISTVTEMTDSGPERKKVKTHESKGSVTLQNFNDAADRLAAKLKAKGGGLGKGLPRVLEETKVVLGRRISSAAERLDQQRRKERGSKGNEPAKSSGFEDLKVSLDQFSTEPKFGYPSMKSHFSDWESEANTDSRHVSGKSGVDTMEPVTVNTEVPGPRGMTNTPRFHKSISQQSFNLEQRLLSKPETGIVRQQSPRIVNYPPASMDTLRYGDMRFDTSKQCWRHIDEEDSDEDPFLTARHTRRESDYASDYPEELELSTISSSGQDKSNGRHRHESVTGASYEELGPGQNSHESPTSASEKADMRGNAQQEMSLAEQSVRHHEDELELDRTSRDRDHEEHDLVTMAANMTMSHTTGYLITAINKRYGQGPWETVRELDLSCLELDSLVGLADFFPSLIALDISGNRVTSLIDLPSSLQILKASGNRLTSHHMSLNHLPNLQVLQLDENRLEDLDALAPLTHLRHLSVSRNHITCVSGLRHLSGLLTFYCHGNMLTEVDFIDLQAYNSLAQLESVDLSRNALQRLVGIDYLDSLQDLDVTGNTLKELDVAHEMPQLRVLKASENSLSFFDIGPFRNIRVLYLDDNELKDIVVPRPLKRIESLSIRRQAGKLRSLDLGLFCEARKLFLSGNAMSDFRLKTTFHSLKYLELAGIQLKQLPADLASKIPNIRVLNLSNNEIRDLQPLNGLERLERLMVPNNRLASAEHTAEVLITLPRLKALDLRANAFTAPFYAPILADHDVDYFAHFDGLRSSLRGMQDWSLEDEKFLSTQTPAIARRREAYENLVWTVCRALRWHDGRFLEAQQLLMADEYVTSFTDESLAQHE